MKDNTHTHSHPNKANMEWLLLRPNDIRGPWGPKISWHLSYRWGKNPKKPHPGNLSRLGIEPGPAAWQARMLPLAPQRWTRIAMNSIICLLNIHTAEGFGIQSTTVMYNLAIRKCASPSFLAPRLKIFQLKFTTPPGIEPRTRGRHATIWASAAS